MKVTTDKQATTYRYERRGDHIATVRDDVRMCKTTQEYDRFVNESKRKLGKTFAGSIWYRRV